MHGIINNLIIVLLDSHMYIMIVHLHAIAMTYSHSVVDYILNVRDVPGIFIIRFSTVRNYSNINTIHASWKILKISFHEREFGGILATKITYISLLKVTGRSHMQLQVKSGL